MIAITFDCKAPRDIDQEEHYKDLTLFLCRARTLLWKDMGSREAMETLPIVVGTLLFHVMRRQPSWSDEAKPALHGVQAEDWQRVGTWRTHPVYLDTRDQSRRGHFVHAGKCVVRIELVNA